MSGIKYDGVGVKPPAKKPVVKPMADGRSYGAGAPKVSDLYTYLQNNHVPYIGGAYAQYNKDTAAAKAAAATPMVGTAHGVAGPSGPSGPTSEAIAAQNAIKTLFGAYNTDGTAPVDDGVLSAQLAQYAQQAQATGSQATAQLQALLGGQQNAYNAQFAAPQVASNPLAAYMQASGAGTDQVDALRNLLGATSQQSAAADQMMNDRQHQSWDNQQAGRQADASTADTAFKQALAASQGAAQAQIAQKFDERKQAFAAAEQKRKDDMMMSILQMAVSNGVDLGALGINFNSAPAAAPGVPAPPPAAAVPPPAVVPPSRSNIPQAPATSIPTRRY